MATTPTPTVGDTKTPTTHDPYLSSVDVADALGVTREYAGRLMRNGTIPGVVDLSTGGVRALLRVRRSDLAAWVATRAL